MTSDGENTYITIEEVATICGVTKRTVRRWIAQEQLPAFRIGTKAIRLRRTDVYAFIEAKPLTATRTLPPQAGF